MSRPRGPTLRLGPQAFGDSVHQTTSAQTWLIGGSVQGVGYRPFACILATELGIDGFVRNRGSLVEIVAAGAGVPTFLNRLFTDHPVTASPELLRTASCEPPAGPGFHILPSRGGEPGGCLVPDQPPCGACLAELADPASRRFGYPFIACSQCGPRYTAMTSLPFDRVATSMSGFPLCSACRAEYQRPGDRRFHAQMMACADCGPSLSFSDKSAGVAGNAIALERSIAALRTGAILAVRGVGGYHLLCDATNHDAVSRLRIGKRRPSKPLAVIFSREGADDLDQLRRFCIPGAAEEISLRSAERPIVLVRLQPGSTLSPALAPGLLELGAMLPYSPLHDLLLSGLGRPVVATSGNVGGEPVLTELKEAERRLASIADGFLHHDRPIANAADDGVVRMIAGSMRPLRIGRGGAPRSLGLTRPLAHPVLALGGQSKVTLALGFGGRAVVSPHLGTLDSPRGMDLLEATAARLERLTGVTARVLVCDAHPAYNGTRWANRQGTLDGTLDVLHIPHHVAHASALAGEFPLEPRWLCFTWDGAGLGEDGTIWGGEALLGEPGGWTRAATFRPFAPPGGDKAAREPWRSAAALAWELGLEWTPGFATDLAHAAWQRRLNCPATSAVGRLFDAAASFLGLAQHTSYEGEGPMAVEAIASEADPVRPLPLREREDGVLEADWAPLVKLLLDPTRDIGRRAATFHACLALVLVRQAIGARERHGIEAIGLTGGVFQNRRLTELAIEGLRQAGFRAYLPIRLPCNDAGLSFGQLVEAAARQ